MTRRAGRDAPMEAVVSRPYRFAARDAQTCFPRYLKGYYYNKLTEENQKLSSLFMEELNVDQDVADVLAKEGFSSINEIAYCSLEEFNSAYL